MGMPTVIGRDDVMRLLDQGAQLVELLDRSEYDHLHLPAAINIPLGDLATEAPRQLDPSRPVIVYCYDYQCDRSPRAAWRLEALGFSEVYDYRPGKADWLAFDLPREGRAAELPTAGRAARRDPPTCRPDETLAAVRDRAASSDKACVVVNDENVVVGELRWDRVGAPEGLVEDAMEPGPATTRPDSPVAQIADWMASAVADHILVTNPDGVLLGLLTREDARRSAPHSR
jgi:rhodanese-related sulfurtransferase/CBS domain-containing protein